MRIFPAILSAVVLLLLPSMVYATPAEPQRCYGSVCQLLPGHKLYELNVFPGHPFVIHGGQSIKTAHHTRHIQSSVYKDILTVELVNGMDPALMSIEFEVGDPIKVLLRPVSQGIPIRFAAYGNSIAQAMEAVERGHSREREQLQANLEHSEQQREQLQANLEQSEQQRNQLWADVTGLLEQIRKLQEQTCSTELAEARRYLEEADTVELFPVNDQKKPVGNQAYVEILRALPKGNCLTIRWQIHNPGGVPLDVLQIQQILPTKPARVLELALAEVPGRREGVLTTIAPGTSAEGVVILPEVTNETFASLALSFVTNSSRQLIASGIEFYPIPDEEKEKRRRDKEAEGRVSIHAVALAGAVWLANPLNKEELDATTLWGIGARAGYGFNRYLSVEGELVYGWSENASFDQGLNRAAKLGRASAGFKLSLGHNIIPTLRIGVGGQAVSHDAQMESGMKVDTSFELDAVWYFSGGVDLRLTKVLKIGAEISLTGQATEVAGHGTTGLVQGGVHIAGSWQP